MPAGNEVKRIAPDVFNPSGAMAVGYCALRGPTFTKADTGDFLI